MSIWTGPTIAPASRTMLRAPLLVAALLPGCLMMEARTALDRNTAGGGLTPGASFSVGGGNADATQAGGFLIGLSSTPLRGDGAAPVLIANVGGRYERAFVRSQPWLRWYGRGSVGRSTCLDDNDDTTADPQCMSKRDASTQSIELGVAFTRTLASPYYEPVSATAFGVAIGLVYTHASDEILGDDRHFIGLAVSVAGIMDFLSPLSGANRYR